MITEGGAVPDAFGIQLLSAPLAAAAPRDGGSWVSTPLDTGRVLLEHPNLDAWFADAHPDAMVLDQARIDLAGLIEGPHDEHHRRW